MSPVRVASVPGPTTSTALVIPTTTTAPATTTNATTTTIATTTTSTSTVTTIASTTTAAAPATTSTIAATTSTVAGVDRSSVRVTVANGTNTVNLARDERNRMRQLGYTQAQATDALGDRRDETVVYVRAGFETTGQLVASDLELTPNRVMPMPGSRVTSDDSGEDVFVVLGNDWQK